MTPYNKPAVPSRAIHFTHIHTFATFCIRACPLTTLNHCQTADSPYSCISFIWYMVVFCCKDSLHLLLSQAAAFQLCFTSALQKKQKNTDPSFSHLFCPALRQTRSENSCVITSQLPSHNHKTYTALTIPVLSFNCGSISETPSKTEVYLLEKSPICQSARFYLQLQTHTHQVRKRAAECVIEYLDNSCDFQQLHEH